MAPSNYLLRLSPALMPLAAAGSALAGLSSRLGQLPSVDNVLFVAYAAVVSGIAPVCVLIGVGFAVADAFHRGLAPYLLAAASAVACGIGVWCYAYGQGLDF